MRIERKKLLIAAVMLGLFILWSIAVSVIDVQPAGPCGSNVGFATINIWFHNLTGINMELYFLTDCLSAIPLLIVLGFALLGLMQWIKRKRLFAVDQDLLVLGGFYLAVISVFCLFELMVVNYRPILINGALEGSYPSSTTMLAMCVMPTAGLQMYARIGNVFWKKSMIAVISLFTVFMVAARLVSGVHWLTDIIGGIMFSLFAVIAYSAVSDIE